MIYSNNDPGLTLTYFIPKLSLVTYAFVWEKVKLLAIGPLDAKLHMEPLMDKGTDVTQMVQVT